MNRGFFVNFNEFESDSLIIMSKGWCVLELTRRGLVKVGSVGFCQDTGGKVVILGVDLI